MILMNTDEIKDFISEARTFYNLNMGRSNFNMEKWRDSFSGTEKYFTAILIYDFIKDRNNSPSTLLWRISPHDEEQILEKILSNKVLQ